MTYQTDAIVLNAEIDMAGTRWRARITEPGDRRRPRDITGQMVVSELPVTFSVRFLGVSGPALTTMMTHLAYRDRMAQLLGLALAALIDAEFAAPTEWTEEAHTP